MSLTTGCSGEGKSADRGGGGRHCSTHRAASTQREAGCSLRTLGTPSLCSIISTAGAWGHRG